MRIEISQLPPEESSPNWQGFWAEKYKSGKDYHRDVFYCCVDARNRALADGKAFPFLKTKLNLTFIFAEERHRDRDNLLASFKVGLDAIVDSALILDDDSEHLEVGQVKVEVDPARAPLTIIELDEIKRLEEQG